METLEIRLLGTIEIFRNGEPLRDFRSQKELALLAYLICEDRPIAREFLAGFGWPESSQAQALGALRRSLHDLKSQLPECLHLDGRTVQFVANDATIDLRTISALIDRNEFESWLKALNLYRAPFLQGLVVHDAPELESWIARKQDLWQQEVAQVYSQVIDHFVVHADFEPALHYLMQLLDLDPWREEAHRQAMLLSARLGNFDDALRLFERCRRILWEELGVEPSRPTTALMMRIKTAINMTPVALPSAATRFVGRDNEVGQLVQLLASPNCRLLTLIGPGGIGKTRLAIQLAGHLSERRQRLFMHGIVFVSLGGASTTAQMLSAMVNALSLVFSSPSSVRTQLFDYLRDKEMLLILDNFEQLLDPDALALVTQILENAPDIKLLITSRIRLHRKDEYLYWLQGLTYPATISLTSGPAPTQLLGFGAIQLFIEAARRIQSAFIPTHDDLANIITICQIVQGMPLAIELAAAWISLLSTADIAGEITHNLDFLSSEMQDLPLRQRSIRAVYETSRKMLTAPELAAFKKLSVFRGSYTREAAQAVAGASLQALAGLVHKSLLRQAQPGYFELHELLRQYGAEELARTGDEKKVAQQSHALYYAKRLQLWKDDLKGSRQQTALREMEIEFTNLQIAWAWLIGATQVEEMEQAAEALGLFLLWHGRYQDGMEAFQAACDVLNRVACLTDRCRVAQIIVTTWHATFCRNLGNLEAASQQSIFAQRLVESVAAQERARCQIPLLIELGMVYWAKHTTRELAPPLFEQSRSLCEQVGDQWGVSNALWALSLVARDQGNYAQAIQYLERTLSLHQLRQDKRGIAETLDLMSVVTMNLGKLLEAETLVHQKISICREISDRRGTAIGLMILGLVGLHLLRFFESISHFEEGLTILAEIGDRTEMGYITTWMGIAYGLQGEYAQATRHGREALSCAQEIGTSIGIAHANMMLGWVAAAQTNYLEASIHLRETIDLFEQLGQRDELAQAMAWLVYAQVGLGHLDEARSLLLRSLRLGVEIGSALPLMEALPALAIYYAKQGNGYRAIQTFALALRYPLVANCPVFEDLAGKHISSYSLSLEPQIVEAAQLQGHVGDVMTTVHELMSELEVLPD